MKIIIRSSTIGILLVGLSLFLYQLDLSALSNFGTSIVRASVSNDGKEGDSGGGMVFTTQNNLDLSGNGAIVAFYSWSSNLITSDGNNNADVFIRDLDNNQTERISVSSLHEEANDFSYFPSVSGDGRYIAFTSRADNLVTDDTNGVDDIFIHDRTNQSTRRISLHSDSSQGDLESSYSDISDDGRFVTFKSSATNLVDNDHNNEWDVFIHDRVTGVTERVSISSNSSEGNDYSYRSSVSQDGRYVAFDSNASNLVGTDTNNVSDVFLRDRQNGTTARISVSSLGEEGNQQSYAPMISSNGKYIIFTSAASNLVPNDTNNANDVFIYDTDTGTTEIVSVSSDGTLGNARSYTGSISKDGRFIVFMSSATNLVLNDTNGKYDIFLHDRETGTTQLISQAEQGELGNNNSDRPVISADARSIAFVSAASNLVLDDTNNADDIFVWRNNDEPAGFDCTNTSGVSQSECDALVALYNSTGGPNWVNHDNWLNTSTPCSWFGVECNNEGIEELHLVNNNLHGEIPPVLENLHSLEVLYVSGNELSGPIPPELGNLDHLWGLYLYDNNLNGVLPAELAHLSNLEQLSLSSNRLNGPIPAGLGNLHNLILLNLSRNELSGAIPTTLGNLGNLLQLSLSANQLTGVIPPELGNLTNLTWLSLSGNQLSGTIPPTLGNLTNLQELWLNNNTLHGPIPAELGNLQNLKVLYLSANQLRGPIPDTFGKLHNLTRLSAYTNQLSGEIPAALSSLTTLSELTLYDNRLTGNIPSELETLTNLRWLTLADNQLTGELPSHLAHLVNLTSLNVSGNAFHGPFPSALTQLTNLSSLFFYNTNLCEPTEAAVQSWLGKLQWFKGTGLPCGATPGGLTGTVTNPSGQPLANIQVSFYRNLSNSLWQRMASTTTDVQGSYTMGGLGQVGYQLFFADPTGQYGDEYYNDAGTLATATTITPTLGATLTVNAQLGAPVLPVATVESATAGVTTDTRTGEVNITMARPHKSDITISRTVTCDGGALPTTVELVMVQVGVTLTYTMQATATPDAYQATIPQADITATAILHVRVTCPNASSDMTIGTLQLYDPSGLVTDSASGLPIVDALVTLYHVPGWHARVDGNDTAVNTCESNLSKTAGAPWSQPAPVSTGVLFNPDTDTAKPDVSTMRTNNLGQYGWDVPAGCWYVVVTATGYETKVSPVVGVPPAVTDLHVALTKNSTATPTPTPTMTPTPPPTVTPTPPPPTPVPTPTPGDLPENEPPHVYLPLVVR